MSIVSHAVLARQMVDQISGDASMRRIRRAMQIMQPGAPTRTLPELSAHILLTILNNYDGRMRGQMAQHDAALARVLNDLDAVRLQGVDSAPRPANLQAQDLQTLVRAGEDISDLVTRVREILDVGDDSVNATKLRNQLEAELGLRRSMAPLGSDTGRLVPPDFATGPMFTPQRVLAADELFHALLEAPPIPQTTRGRATELTGAQLGGARRVGTPGNYRWTNGSDRVAAAARALVDSFGGDVRRAVRQLLAAAPDADGNRMAIALLLEHGRLSPGSRATHRGPNSSAFAFQEGMTGTSFEFTGHLDEWIRGLNTVGIDGINRGILVDPKWTGVPTEVTPHLVGMLARAERFASPREGADVVEQMMRTGLSRQVAENIVDAHQSIKVANLLERQLHFASSNGLLGVRWVCSTLELAEGFEAIFHQSLAGRYRDLSVEFIVGASR